MTRASIYGLSVVLPDQCRNCNSNGAFVGDAPPPHFAQLKCDGCDCGRGYVGHDFSAFLEEFIKQFGRPTEPIELRTGKVREPEQRGGDAAQLQLQLQTNGNA
jgi:hypothetical protein